MKKVLLVAGALGLAILTAPMFAAFEAHVVNVTATIENALSVPVDPINFGTVFPQEHLDRTLVVALSQSFKDEGRVDNVDYFIRQKPKCAWSWQEDGVWTIDEGSTETGHVVLAPTSENPDAYYVDCGNPIRPEIVPSEATWGELPSLCEYISKHPDGVDDGGEELLNDESLNSFHAPFTVSNGVINWNQVSGRLSKLIYDTIDTWTIDLAVPCFGGHCAQDWEEFVYDINPEANAADYVQDLGNEHKVFGCDLWIEVFGVSETDDIGQSEPTALFLEDFNDGNYDGWLIDHFDTGSTGTPESDVLATSTNAYEGVSLRIEDNAAVYRNISTLGYENIEFSYCRRTSSSSGTDRLRVGWKTGSASNLWTDYTQLEEFAPDTAWDCTNFGLPTGANNGDISIAFFFDNGEGDYGLIDAIGIEGSSL